MPNATITESIKFAGPDSDGNFKVLQTKNTTLVFPGEVYTMSAFKELVEKEWEENLLTNDFYAAAF